MSARLRRSFVAREAVSPLLRDALAPSILTASLVQSALAIGLALTVMLDASYRISAITPLLSAAAVVTALYILSATFSNRTETVEQATSRNQSHNAEQLALIKERVSHELRTPLNAVIGFSEIMQREVLGPVGNERYREYAGHIRKSAEHFQTTTEKALAVTALLAGPSEAEQKRLDFTAWALTQGASIAQSRAVYVSGNRANLDEAVVHLQSAIGALSEASNAPCHITAGLTRDRRAYLRFDISRPEGAPNGTTGAALPGLDLNLLLARLAAQSAGADLTTGISGEMNWRAEFSLPTVR